MSEDNEGIASNDDDEPRGNKAATTHGSHDTRSKLLHNVDSYVMRHVFYKTFLLKIICKNILYLSINYIHILNIDRFNF